MPPHTRPLCFWGFSTLISAPVGIQTRRQLCLSTISECFLEYITQYPYSKVKNTELFGGDSAKSHLWGTYNTPGRLEGVQAWQCGKSGGQESMPVLWSLCVPGPRTSTPSSCCIARETLRNIWGGATWLRHQKALRLQSSIAVAVADLQVQSCSCITCSCSCTSSCSCSCIAVAVCGRCVMLVIGTGHPAL